MAVKISRDLDDKDRKATVNDPAVKEDWLVDRFLIEAADHAPEVLESGFLFYLNDGRSRLDERWLIEFAIVFGKQYHSNPAAALASPTSAWDSSFPEALDRRSVGLRRRQLPNSPPRKGWR